MSGLSPFLALLVAAAVLAGCRQPPVDRRGPPQALVVSRVSRLPMPKVRAGILEAFATSPSRLPYPFSRMTASELTPPRFPPDWLETTVDPGGFLAAYKRLPPASRAQDLLIQDPIGEAYWPSEYAAAAGPVRFRCGFILHFVDQAAGGLEIQVYELVPTAWAGEHWAWAAHGVGFGRYHDLRFVEPTINDRAGVLDLVEHLVNK